MCYFNVNKNYGFPKNSSYPSSALWIKIWNSDLNRIFTSDFEIYGEKAHNPENAEVDIFIAMK